jgi:hypothetical protein
MHAAMGQSADQLFATINDQLLRVFAAAEATAASGGGQPPCRGAKYALNVMLQGMNVPAIAEGITQVRCLWHVCETYLHHQAPAWLNVRLHGLGTSASLAAPCHLPPPGLLCCICMPPAGGPLPPCFATLTPLTRGQGHVRV